MKPLLLLLFLSVSAQAQPADCALRPGVPGDTMSLDMSIPLAGLPGAPKAASGGYVGFGLQNVPARGTSCGASEPVLPRDVLRGAPAGDLLLGTPPAGKVYIDVQ